MAYYRVEQNRVCIWYQTEGKIKIKFECCHPLGMEKMWKKAYNSHI